MTIKEVVEMSIMGLGKARVAAKKVRFVNMDELFNLMKESSYDRRPLANLQFFRQLALSYPVDKIDFRRLFRFLVANPESLGLAMELIMKVPTKNLPPAKELIKLRKPFSENEIRKRIEARKEISVDENTNHFLEFLVGEKEAQEAGKSNYLKKATTRVLPGLVKVRLPENKTVYCYPHHGHDFGLRHKEPLITSSGPAIFVGMVKDRLYAVPVGQSQAVVFSGVKDSRHLLNPASVSPINPNTKEKMKKIIRYLEGQEGLRSM